MNVVLERRRSWWDVVVGVLLVLGGFLILGDVVAATVVSVLLLGWTALLCGVLALGTALLSIGKRSFWLSAVTGGLLTVLGLLLLRNPTAGALALTLLAGGLILSSGLTRIAAAFHDRAYRWPLLLGGAVSTVLGLLILLNIFSATLTLLGVLLGVHTLFDGVTLLMVGRVHTTPLPYPQDDLAPDWSRARR